MSCKTCGDHKCIPVGEGWADDCCICRDTPRRVCDPCHRRLQIMEWTPLNQETVCHGVLGIQIQPEHRYKELEPYIQRRLITWAQYLMGMEDYTFDDVDQIIRKRLNMFDVLEYEKKRKGEIDDTRGELFMLTSNRKVTDEEIEHLKKDLPPFVLERLEERDK